MNKKWALGNVGSGLTRLHSAQEWRMAMLGRSGPFRTQSFCFLPLGVDGQDLGFSGQE